MNEVSLKISFTNAAFEITISKVCLTPKCLLRSLINVTCISLLAGHVLIVYILYSTVYNLALYINPNPNNSK